MQSILDWIIKSIKYGELTIYLPGGDVHHYKGKLEGPKADVTFLDKSAFYQIAGSGALGFAEAYLDNKWKTDDLESLLTLAALNLDFGRKKSDFLPTVKSSHDYQKYKKRANTVAGAKKNVKEHYDLGNDFFDLWLDKSRTYSCAIFEPKNVTGPVNIYPDISVDLYDAQIRKYERILELADVREGQTLVEIGCGWGGFATYAAKTRGCKVTGLTISDEQFAGATELVKKESLQELVEIRLIDYRKVEGQFDRVISIAMYEQVGEEYWAEYFSILNKLAKPDGQIFVHGISIRDDLFPRHLKTTEYLSQYIFPGGKLMSPAVMATVAAESGLRVSSERFIGPHYAETLRRWQEKFEEVLPEVRKQGFDERFIRMWRFYLDYAIAGFATGRLDLIQMVFVPDKKYLPRAARNRKVVASR